MVQKLAIYIAEEFVQQSHGDEMEEWHHAYLALVDETSGKPFLLEHLHFTDGWEGMVADLRKCDPPKPLKEQKGKDFYYPLIGGTEEQIIKYWKTCQSFAQEVNKNKPKFGQDFRNSVSALNCRSGVVGALKSCDLAVHQEFFQSAAGFEARELLSTASRVRDNSHSKRPALSPQHEIHFI